MILISTMLHYKIKICVYLNNIAYIIGTEITNWLPAQPQFATFFISIILPPDLFLIFKNVF